MTETVTKTTAGLSRRGRPPKVNYLGDNKYAVNVRGKALTFVAGTKGLRLVTKNTELATEDVNYAKSVIGREISIS